MWQPETAKGKLVSGKFSATYAVTAATGFLVAGGEGFDSCSNGDVTSISSFFELK